MVGASLVWDWDWDNETPDLSPLIRLIFTLGPVEKTPKLFLQANVAQRRQRVFPVPVGLSSSALDLCIIIHVDANQNYTNDATQERS